MIQRQKARAQTLNYECANIDKKKRHWQVTNVSYECANIDTKKRHWQVTNFSSSHHAKQECCRLLLLLLQLQPTPVLRMKTLHPHLFFGCLPAWLAASAEV